MNATEFCQHVENRLGWDPYALAAGSGKPLWKVTAAEAGKLNKKIKTDPELYSWDNLLLTVEYLYRERRPVASPTAVCWHVRDALRRAQQPEVGDDLSAQIAVALDLEGEAERPGQQLWIGRLTRASGAAREEVLTAWRKERGQLFGASPG